MRAVVIREPGGPEVLEVAELEVREPNPGEVRIRVRAAAVNPTDIGLRERGIEDLPPPWIPGMDAAGTVDGVGRGVERLELGDRVMAALTPRRPEGGAQAEQIVVPAASVVEIPTGATLHQAATLPMNGLTARLGLEQLGLAEGASLAVTGGAGLLASYVIPLAKAHGLYVLADASARDEDLVRSFGADAVVPRGERFTTGVRKQFPDGVDAVFDTALLYRDAFPAIKDDGEMAVVRGWGGGATERGIKVHAVQVSQALERTDWLEELRRLASEGEILLRVAKEFAPEQAAEAHKLMTAGGLRGRAVIVF